MAIHYRGRRFHDDPRDRRPHEGDEAFIAPGELDELGNLRRPDYRGQNVRPDQPRAPNPAFLPRPVPKEPHPAHRSPGGAPGSISPGGTVPGPYPPSDPAEKPDTGAQLPCDTHDGDGRSAPRPDPTGQHGDLEAAPIYSRDSSSRELPPGMPPTPPPSRGAAGQRSQPSARARTMPDGLTHPATGEPLAAGAGGRPAVVNGERGPWGGVAGGPVRSVAALEAGRVLASGQPGFGLLVAAGARAVGRDETGHRAAAAVLFALVAAGAVVARARVIGDRRRGGLWLGCDLRAGAGLGLRLPWWVWAGWAAGGWRRGWSAQRTGTARKWLARVGVAGPLSDWLGCVAAAGGDLRWPGRVLDAAEWAGRLGRREGRAVVLPSWVG